jgi:hypothetical protein
MTAVSCVDDRVATASLTAPSPYSARRAADRLAAAWRSWPRRLCAAAVVLLPLMLVRRLCGWSARARRRSSELLRSVLPSGMIGTAADNNDGDGDYQLDDMTQLTRPRTSVTGRSEASLTGVWTRHARTIDGNQSWTDKIGGRVVSDTTDDIILVSHDQPWTTVDEGTMLANRSARSSTLTSITDIANALESSALTSQQKAMVRRFGWTNNIATVMKGSQYRDLESLFLLEAKSFRETSSSQRPSRDGVGARQSVGGAGSPPTPPRRSRDGAMARLTAGGAVPLPPRPTPAADYQVAVVNELLARPAVADALESTGVAHADAAHVEDASRLWPRDRRAGADAAHAGRPDRVPQRRQARAADCDADHFVAVVHADVCAGRAHRAAQVERRGVGGADAHAADVDL